MYVIYLIDNKHNKVNWLPSYTRNLCKGFEELGEEYEVIDKFYTHFEKTDTVIIVDYLDLPEAVKLKRGMGENCPILISHSHGSSAFELGYKGLGEREEEEYELRAMDIVPCNTHFHTLVMEREMKVNSVFTGYPMDFEKITKCAKGIQKEEKIVVGGRLGIDRQLYLAVETLKVYGKQVTFCVTHGKEYADNIWGEGSINRYEKMFNLKWNCPQEEFYEELASAKVIVSFGCVDTLNISLIEGAVLGAYPVAPKKFPYNEYLSDGYSPYDIRDIRERIETRPALTVGISQYDYLEVAKRYVKAIKEKMEERK